MKRWYIILLALLFVACHHDENEPDVVSQRVVIVYMAAENSLSGYATSDVNEIRRATGNIPDSCKVVVYMDGSSDEMPQILTFDNRKGEQTLYKYKFDPISTDSSTMQQVLELVIQRCPARSYGLVLWSHGSGWIPEPPTTPAKAQPKKTIGIDNGQNTYDNTGKEMEITTLANILRRTNAEWDYIFFDACFMQGVEVAYELRDITDWCIGSPAEIPAEGAPYDYIMGSLFAEKEQVWTIARDYYEYYLNNGGLVISVIRTSEMEALAQATRPYLQGLSEYPNTASIQRYLSFKSSKQWKPEYFDMGSAMSEWLNEEEYPKWRDALYRAVPYHYFTQRWRSSFMNLSGWYPIITVPDEFVSCVSMYIPIKDRVLNEHFTRTSWYRDVWKP